MSTPDENERPLYGLHALMDDAPAVPLPLKAVDARFEVSGDCAQVMMEQIFEFDGPNPVDVLYTFPLPSDASVHLCTMSVDGRWVVATVKALEEARKDFKKAHEAGKRAALVETVRENLFELRLGNVQPGDRITLALSYTCPLAADGRQRRLRIPVCPGIRFIPGKPEGLDGGTDLVPDAGRLLPIRINESHPDAATFFCAGTLSGASELDSPSHEIEILATGADERIPVLLSDDSEVPDRDFVLTWEAPPATLALMGRDDPDYLLCSVRAPDDFPTGREGRDIFFLLDASGSMGGLNWSALVEAVDLALAELGPKDRFAIDLFACERQPITEGLIAADGADSQRIVELLRRHSPGGGTQFTNAFATTIDQAGKARRPVIVVVTDGQFGDEARACSVARDCHIEVHTVGIDACVNEGALQKIARRTRGSCSLCVPGEDLDVKMHQLVANLLSPAIHHISAGSEWVLVGNPPPLRPGQSTLIPFQRKDADRHADHPSDIEVEMNFTDGSIRRQTFDVLMTAGRAPAILAAKAGITAHLDEDEQAKAIELASRFNVICEGAAFVAIDEANEVPVATATFEQPSIDPAYPAGPIKLFMRVHSSQDRSVREHRSDVLYSLDERVRLHSLASPDERQEPVRKLAALRRPSFKESLGRRLKELTSKFQRSNGKDHEPTKPSVEATLSSSREGWLADASRVDCFDIQPWRKLLENTLIPWAEENSANARLLDRLLRDLVGICQSGGDPAEAISCFEELRAFLPEQEDAMVGRFLESARTRITGKVAI